MIITIGSNISVAEAATIINAIIVLIQATLPLSLVIILIFFISKTQSAISWSSISRMLHSSTWPTILRTDSSSSPSSGGAVSRISRLTMLTEILMPIASVTLPLGLHDGPLLLLSKRDMSSKYVPDPSALALATTPNRSAFIYGELCTTTLQADCGDFLNHYADNVSYIPSIVEIFNSAPHGLFTMQYRRFINDPDEFDRPSSGVLNTIQSLIATHDDLIMIGSLVVDMSSEHPGIGFWNQTVPDNPEGGTWTSDVLWLDPVTECVNTNLTVDYVAANISEDSFAFAHSNITDRGGFFRLTRDPLPLNYSAGQDIDLRQRAYKGAVYSNLAAMEDLKITRESSSNGQSYPISLDWDIPIEKRIDNRVAGSRMANLNLLYSNSSLEDKGDILNSLCVGLNTSDTLDPSKIQVVCGMLLGPPLRMDGGDPENFELGSSWSQELYACASATRASIQSITFRTNDSSTLQGLNITRQLSNSSSLWGVEKLNITMRDGNLIWGLVDEKFENHSSLSTIRSAYLYLPAGISSVAGNTDFPPIGQPLSSYRFVWLNVYQVLNTALRRSLDYLGEDNYSLRTKLQAIIQNNTDSGPASVRNLAWTDIMANLVVGTESSPTLFVAPFRKSLSYDFRFAIPAFILLALWAPTCLTAVFLLVTRRITFGYIRKVLNHTSIGRAVVGSSALRVQEEEGDRPSTTLEPDPNTPISASIAPSEGVHEGVVDELPKRGRWADTVGKTLVTLNLNREGSS